MDFNQLQGIHKESERIKALYNIFDESKRLSSKAGRVEFLTTVRQVEKYLRPDMKILDLGAGTGEYSLYFANKGYEVTAIELVDKHVEQITAKAQDGLKLRAHQGTALDLSNQQDNSYDIVLCFGPLYHLEDRRDRLKCMDEVRRVCKTDGIIFYAFIGNDMVVATETKYSGDEYIKGSTYNHDTMRVNNFPFVFHTVDDCRELINDAGLSILGEIASDGMSELLADTINAMDDEGYEKWLNYHFYCSEKPEFLGASNHFLFITKIN